MNGVGPRGCWTGAQQLPGVVATSEAEVGHGLHEGSVWATVPQRPLPVGARTPTEPRGEHGLDEGTVAGGLQRGRESPQQPGEDPAGRRPSTASSGSTTTADNPRQAAA